MDDLAFCKDVNQLWPGRVKQKAGLTRAMLTVAWGEFSRQLRWCGHESADNRKNQALFA